MELHGLKQYTLVAAVQVYALVRKQCKQCTITLGCNGLKSRDLQD